MALLKPIFEISEICSSKGIKDAVLCPGSRSASLTLAFARNPEISTKVISDERSAAFVAMGQAQMSARPVALVCTSGTAALNFGPTIAEAFFQEIPLLVPTADRPAEWINQYDGQTIFQNEIFGKHVKKSYHLTADYSHPDAQWQIARIINEAIDLSQTAPFGPVHINIPIREPFYPEATEAYEFKQQARVIEHIASEKKLSTETWANLLEIWENSDQIMIAVGQNQENIAHLLENLSETENVVVLADVISNCQNESVIQNHDLFLDKIEPKNAFTPELLITTGKSFISKTFKQFIRNNKPKYHWHIQENEVLFDPFQSITHRIPVASTYFFNELLDSLEIRKFRNADDEDDETNFLSNFQKINQKATQYTHDFIKNSAFGEMTAMARIFEKLPENSVLHLGNSMPVRYANYLQNILSQNTTVYANRGTSGIDGIVSTAIGQAYKTDKMVYCLLGDVSFFYDANAFWNRDLPENLKVIILNNGGGNIFRIIDGPNRQPELEEYFVATHSQTAKAIAENNKIKYWEATNFETLDTTLAELFKPELGILEIFVDGKADAERLKDFKSGFRK